jgi:uncharacterized membrane protein
MEARPRMQIELTSVDKVLETVCLTILLVLWVGTVSFFSKLPDQIPSHFNASGQADDFSDSTHIFVLPVVATIIYIGMTIINNHPHICNYRATITAENAKQLYSSATRLIRVLKLAVVIIFSGMVFMTIKTTLANNDRLGDWFLPTAIALLTLPNIFYLLKSSNAKQA